MIEQRGGYVHLKLVQMNLPFGMLSLICSNTFLGLLQNSFLVFPVEGATGHQSNRKPALEIHQPCTARVHFVYPFTHQWTFGILVKILQRETEQEECK